MSVVIVTGASSGIGRATALMLAQRGDAVVLAARSARSLEEARAECEAAGAQTLAVPTDVGDRDAVETLFGKAEAQFGRVDGVVHAAAVLAYGRFEDVPPDVFDGVQRTNVLGTANVARAALAVFREQGAGSLVVVGSVLGKISATTMSSYATSKWAVHGLVRTLQAEARHLPGIGVTLVAPGGVSTPIYTQAGNYVGYDGRPPPPVDPPERVARVIVGALDRPRRESSVGLANPLMVAGFRLLPGLFDVLIGPLMRLLATSREPREPGPGNVLEPRPEDDRTHGGWRTIPGR
ncbi:MAG TPA: SDR family NAD(P)-dependent oxidoreductase [Nocardioidaceae bacterium]|jgi:NAD(P)-dependent dehydrogenase (short-subunit alcohol dehydrogenase family)|nr:SDR family NAD(P)-dependent oxidoreductase [Nocardioidaceae bacterium]